MCSATSQPHHQLVERPEPGRRGDPCVERRDRAVGDRAVEIGRDEHDEAVMQPKGLGPEQAAGAEAVHQQQAGHRAMPGEDGKHRIDGARGARDGVRCGLALDGALDLVDQPVRRGAHELHEDRFLGREVEVDAALGGLGLPGDVIDGGVAVAGPAEHVERRIEDALPPPAGSAPRSGSGAPCPRAHPRTNRPVGRSATPPSSTVTHQVPRRVTRWEAPRVSSVAPPGCRPGVSRRRP